MIGPPDRDGSKHTGWGVVPCPSIPVTRKVTGQVVGFVFSRGESFVFSSCMGRRKRRRPRMGT